VIALGATACAAGMFLAALLSWSRLAEAMALDRWLPATLALAATGPAWWAILPRGRSRRATGAG